MRLTTDLRTVVRGLAKQPGFAAVAILTLALGIGANTAVFSVLNSVVLAPLPYDEPDQLVRLYTATSDVPLDKNYLSVPDALDLRDQDEIFSSVGVLYTYRETGGDLASPGGPPRRVRLLEVSSGYFKTVGASPMLGRTFAADEERDDAALVVLSHRLWRDVGRADPAIVGQSIQIDGRAREVIGVMRPGFRDVSGDDVAAWVPVDLTRGSRHGRRNHFLSAVGRLRSGVNLVQAQSRLDAMTTRLASEYQQGRAVKIVRAVPLSADIIGDSRGSLVVLMGAAGLVLLIACLNVANLFLAKSLGQARELAVRTALGANRTRLVSERLAESLVVAVAGGVVGSLVAFWGVRLLLAVSPESLARAEEVGIDPRLLAFALITTVATGLVFGAGPAWRASRADPTEALREGSRGNTHGRGSGRVRDLLVAGQVGIALILLVGAGTLMQAFVALQRVDLGFNAERVTTFEVNLPDARYADPAARVRFHQALRDRLATVPGVTNVGATSWLPANGNYHSWGFDYLGTDGSEQSVGAQVRVIDGDFIAALQIPILAGRVFTSADGVDTAGVALVSANLAKAAYPGRIPLGERFQTGGRTFRIVGVVGDVAQEAGGAKGPQVYLSHLQFAGDRNWTLNYVVRATAPVAAMVEAARAELAQIDPGLVLFQARSLEDVAARHRARERFTLLLMATFATVALALAAIGLYGVLSYSVAQRGHEIGVRMALGARPGQVRGAVLRHGLLIAGAGMAVGIVGAVASSRVLQSVVAGAPATNPATVVGVVLLLGAVVLAAGYLPARRATRVDPLEALRRE